MKGQDFSKQNLQRSNFTAADCRDCNFKVGGGAGGSCYCCVPVLAFCRPRWRLGVRLLLSFGLPDWLSPPPAELCCPSHCRTPAGLQPQRCLLHEERECLPALPAALWLHPLLFCCCGGHW